MKKIILLALAMIFALSMLTVPAMAEEAEEPADVYALTEGAEIGFWLATVANVGGNEWECFSDGYYVAATFTAAKPFSAIAVPYWAGNPNNFGGIVPCDVEFALFNAVDNYYGEDYKSEDAVVLLNMTCAEDRTEFVWEFDQLPAGRYCFRVTQLTEEGAYIVIAQGDPADDDAEFDVENVAQNTRAEDGVALTIIYDAEGTTPADPTDKPADATDAPADATDVPAEPTEVPAEPTEVPATEVPATEVPATEIPATEVPATEAPATDTPATDAPAATDKVDDQTKDNKGPSTGLIIGIVAAVVLVAAVICGILIAKKKKK